MKISEFPSAFVDAFNHAMLYEVGRWDPTDSDVIAGKIDTSAQRRKVGYVNDPVDPGGETKYGVAQNANTDINVRTLNLEGAMNVYYKRYWLLPHCDKLASPLAVLHFDGCVNHGISRGCKFLQQAAGVAKVDGIIGPVSMAAIESKDPHELCSKICALREQFYYDIVKRKPSQSKYIKGWINRITNVKKHVLSM